MESGKSTAEDVPSVAGEGSVSGTSTIESEGDDVEGVPEGDGIVGDGIIVGVGGVCGDGEEREVCRQGEKVVVPLPRTLLSAIPPCIYA